MLKDLLRYTIILWISVRFIRGIPVEEIVRTAKLNELRAYMNETLDPCEDFYEFSCANWPTFHPTGPLEKRNGYFELMQTEFERKVKELLVTDDASDTKADLKVKHFYVSCLNLKEVAGDYSDKLREIIGEFGQMPAIEGDNWNEGDFDWQKTVAEIAHKYVTPILANANIQEDFNDESVKSIILMSGLLLLDAKSHYFDDEYKAGRKAFQKSIAEDMKSFLKIDPDVADVAAKEIFDFETALAHGLSDDGLPLNQTYTPTTMEQMQISYAPNLDVEKLVSTVHGSVPPFGCYEDSDYLHNLVEVMAETPNKVVANYVFYKLAKFFMYEAKESAEDQQSFCVSQVKQYFGMHFENLVYRKYNTKQTQDDVDEMWKNIKATFEDVLRSPRLSWMGEDTRQYAVEKLHAMDIKIPALTQFLSEADVDQWQVNKHDYVENMRLILLLGSKDMREDIYKPIEPSELEGDGFSPMNFITKNVVTFPVTVLQPYYLWSPAVPNAFNFAKLGSLLSHELLHGFDDEGRLHGKTGENQEWWDEASASTFSDFTQCFADQYSKYILSGKPLPMPPLQGENIADNGGIRLAYHAYLKWYQDSARTTQELARETFPSLHYNHKQLFFISFAQLWCTTTDPEYTIELATDDEHAPAEFRIIGPLSNLKEFSEEFNCPLGSAMNPSKKCAIY